jgi:hypothetical protein
LPDPGRAIITHRAKMPTITNSFLFIHYPLFEFRPDLTRPSIH